MMFETCWGGIVNLGQALQLFREDNYPTYEVMAIFAATDGVLNDEEGLGELWLHRVVIYHGTRDECDAYITWVKEELGVKTLPPDLVTTDAAPLSPHGTHTLTFTEASLIVGALAGVELSPNDAPTSVIVSHVSKEIADRDLSARSEWRSCNLMTYLESLSEDEASVLLNKVKDYWRNAPHSDTKTGLRRVGILETQEANAELPD